MTFDTLKKRAARELKLIDSSGDIATGKDISETDIGNAINDAYIEDAFPTLVTQYPENFERVAFVSNYTETTASTSSTSTTLVLDEGVLNTDMENVTVYNSTDSESAKITSVTNSTTATLDTTIGDTWDSDTVQVLNNVVVFNNSGDMSDYYSPMYIYVRYSTTGDRVKASFRHENDAIQTNLESYNQVYPIYIPRSVQVGGEKRTGFQILPYMTTPDSKAIKMQYVEKPALLSGDNDEPRLPLGHHRFLAWKAVEELAAGVRRDMELASYAAQKYEQGTRDMLGDYGLGKFDQPVSVGVPRRLGMMDNRDI